MKEIYKILIFAALGFGLILYFNISKTDFLILYDKTLQVFKSRF